MLQILRMRYTRIFGNQILILMILMNSIVEAKDFGKVHNTFEIQEERFLEMIKRKMQLMDMEKFEHEWKESIKTKAIAPIPVVGIGRSKKSQQRIVNMDYELPEDVILEDGRVMYLKGTKVNPLDYIRLDRKIYFFDGDEEKDLKWIGDQNLGERDLLILVKGKPFEVKKKLGREIYFDQQGQLCKRFDIRNIPSIVMQVGEEIIVEEIEN